MKGFLFLRILISFAIFSSLVFGSELISDRFSKVFESFFQNGAQVPSEEYLNNRRDTVFVLVKGFGGDEPPVSYFYFLPLRKELERLTKTSGVKDPRNKRVFVLVGDSKLGFEPNVARFKSEMKAILDQIPKEKKVFLIGHSKGAIESWTMLMQSPEIAHERLGGALFLQGPFQGSPLADFVVSGKRVSDIEPFNKNPLEYLIRSMLLRRGAAPQVLPAIRQLTSLYASQHVDKTLNEQQSIIDPNVWKKTLFLWTKHQTPSLLNYFVPPNNAFMDLCHRTLTKISGNPNSDGFVLVPDRSLPSPLKDRTLVMDGFHHSAFDVGKAGRALARTLFELSNPE